MFKVQHGVSTNLSTYSPRVPIVRRLEAIAGNRRIRSSLAQFPSQYRNRVIDDRVGIHAVNKENIVINSEEEEEVVSNIVESRDVRVVVMLRKKTKEKINWIESITRGTHGGAILIQLVSERIDPG